MIEKPLAPVQFWWIVQKDLRCGIRSCHSLPRILLFGVVVAFLLNYQVVLPAEHLSRVSASLCWIAICFASVLNFGHSVASEREEGCWDALLRYPVAAETVFFAKLTTNALVLGAMQMVVIPFFALASGASWLSHPGRLLPVILLANLGVASLGTLFAASVTRHSQHQGVMTLILLPLLVPMMLAASEATRLVADPVGASGWSQWVKLLMVFAVVYVTLGWMLFQYLIED